MSLSEVLEKSAADEKKFIGFWNGISRGVEASNSISRQYSFVNDVLKKKNNRDRKVSITSVYFLFFAKSETTCCFLIAYSRLGLPSRPSRKDYVGYFIVSLSILLSHYHSL
ncbi:hypothetical protein EON65_08400 [archaeon]|nr:MAG: hypothetical protein EON65_08400 [archaeon]